MLPFFLYTGIESMMTPIQVLDRLAGKHVSRIDFKNGHPLICPRPVLVDYTDEDGRGEFPQMWIGVEEDGLTLHYNAKDQHGEMRGHSEPLSNIAYVS